MILRRRSHRTALWAVGIALTVFVVTSTPLLIAQVPLFWLMFPAWLSGASAFSTYFQRYATVDAEELDTSDMHSTVIQFFDEWVKAERDGDLNAVADMMGEGGQARHPRPHGGHFITPDYSPRSHWNPEV